MQGIVTLEDLLEEIVGEIEDEYDAPDDAIEQIDERRVRIDGTYPIDDFNDRYQLRLPTGDFHTLAGLVFDELGRAPSPGDRVTIDGISLLVVDTDGPRVERLEIELSSRDPVENAPAAEQSPGG